ncbi:hypothetical protein MIB92_18480 [Aestuariirhabdus sp. Z084]|uniref:hypothetical protein n=1 Tax=Aestuariirhabdus haliotis TaxID=2918751 RepID=UPI00201B3DF6|nr:hypothetical protein [Aestuariirhabdus haliotis]MCL6417652.1 hypothetical protein [Aestuariirhabdus haliotis]MCL6421586.1 hypothetical protein [Aestuariirhabdus haliotis]
MDLYRVRSLVDGYSRPVMIVSALLALTGCSVAAYTPVVGTAAVGAGQESLNELPEYRSLINTPLTLLPEPGQQWTLRRFSGGRFFVERSPIANRSTELICLLADGQLIIDEIYEDRINGGLYYSGKARCDESDDWLEVPRNHWYPKGMVPLVE